MTYLLAIIVPPAVLLAWVFYLLYWLRANYLKARTTGLPLIILPFDCGNPLWLTIDRKVVNLVRRLPFASGSNFTRFAWRGWEIIDRSRAHQELGDAFIFVTSGKNYLQLCDAEAVGDIFHRRGDFPRPPEATEMLNVFGPNLGTTDGSQWRRHRKITAPCFNENINAQVWTESIDQASAMLQYWSSQPSINSVADDTRTLSLHVMSSAVFGKSYPFKGANEASTSPDQDSTSYRDSLRMILDNCIPLIILGRKNLSKKWLPKSWRELYQATRIFQAHMTKAYEDEKQAIDRGDGRRHNLLTALVRNSQTSMEEDKTKSDDSQNGLTEEEIYGNIFVFNFAGHDATASSLALGICLLATRPDVQDWIAEEINSILKEEEPKSSYETTFPRLKRCLAVAFETVRLYTAVAISKSVGPEPQTLTIQGKPIVIPGKTIVLPNYSALHTHPRYWGEDGDEFEPSRWIVPASDTSKDTETFKEPAKTNSPFVGWSGGARNCVGRKFSQVEFVGVLVGLFCDYKARPSRQAGENDAMARARLAKQIKTDTGMRLLLQMLHPEKAMLEWVKR